MDLFKIEKKVAKKWTAHGLDCVVTFHGQHNGYARVSKGHPLFGVGYNEKIDIKPNWNRSMEDGAFGGMLALLSGHDAAEEWLRTPEGLIEVHGGVTYAGEYCPLIPETDPWWFG
ncbi:MAG: hypothetical protein GTN93_10620, partial [Anaerolineae bacterium]|nr:hypothetical protein [Anaerolineae bacterium]